MSFFTKVGSWLFGGGGVEKVADVADKAFHTEQEKSETDQKDLESAREDAKSMYDSFVDKCNRAQRPGWGFYLFGCCVGWWSFPDVKEDTLFASMLVLYFTFLFGGRALLKDLPQCIRSMRGLK